MIHWFFKKKLKLEKNGGLIVLQFCSYAVMQIISGNDDLRL